ncbi:rhamnogalacturonides degradation protein RhiN [Aquipluma nitroreducens]|uniref:Rhamnogalacturonides degradation protein RhiN n=1 Tax=Aquipluma nitroreducens TaxID=2010828 RepID=A0A5K7S3W0_9BACT|nr:glycoside hydrolase family 88 protein [Aquipluma nitroreducens]BBE16160.1 rhamnogalacturonides degradation protein RhiN [Aquipluma nitroreducens]
MKRINLIVFYLSMIQVAFSQPLSKQIFLTPGGNDSESYLSFTFNGMWNMDSSPRAIHYEGNHQRTYSGWIDNYGDIHVACYDHKTGDIQSKTLHDSLQINDRYAPALTFDKHGRLIVFFSQPGGTAISMIRANSHEEISEWSDLKVIRVPGDKMDSADQKKDHYISIIPVMLPQENGRIYVFISGTIGKSGYSYSDDDGETWSGFQWFFDYGGKSENWKTDLKLHSNGKDKVHLLFTHESPNNKGRNFMNYLYYQGGHFFTIHGQQVKKLPINPDKLDIVYDAIKNNEIAVEGCDIAQDDHGSPVIAYMNFPNDSTHVYSYARWNGKIWAKSNLLITQGFLPPVDEGSFHPCKYYSGGISIDHESPNTVYFSVKRDSIFEIDKWSTPDLGASWEIAKITNGSTKDNIRPCPVLNAKDGNPLQVLWMQNTNYGGSKGKQEPENLPDNFKDRFHSSIKMNLVSPLVKSTLKKGSVASIMRRVADWQLANPIYDLKNIDWHYGTFYVGLRALYEVNHDDKYKDELINIGQSKRWHTMDEYLHADQLLIIDSWAWLYQLDKSPIRIDHAKKVVDYNLEVASQEKTDVRFDKNRDRFKWWSWCDALFMAPPSFAHMWKVTGEIKYLEYLDAQWWKTSDYLYSKDDSLYYRDDRYFEERSANNRKIFWARGNGWVVAGLARVLSLMPGDYRNRKAFEQQYREMAEKLIRLQGDDGLWRVSLLDPEYLNIGESSSSALITYALAWGINNGLLGKKYQVNVEKAWSALCRNVNQNGRLGYVQQVAGSPYPFFEYQWHVYASGAFLLAGKEMITLENE